jgi:hypothetical protein
MSEDKTTVLHDPSEDEEYDDEYAGPGRTIAIAAVVAIVLAVAGFFVGHASAKSGPSTLAEAVQQAQSGKLACGDTGTAANAAATPPAGGGAGAGAGAAGGPGGFANGNGAQFLVRAICDQGQNGTAGAGAAGGAGGATGGQEGLRGRGGFGGAGGFGQVGQVQSVTGDTLTLQGRQGSIKVKLSSSTTVRKTTTGSISDIKPGDTVSVAGTGQNNANPATSITIVPAQQ